MPSLPKSLNSEGLEPRGQHFQFVPFGSGRRGCPGMGLAQCFDWAAAAGDVEAIDMEEAHGLVCARKHPLLLRPAPSLNPFPVVV